MTFWNLISAFKNGTVITLHGPDAKHGTGFIHALQREDGSGKCWIVHLRDNRSNKTIQIFVRTTD